MTIDDIRQIVQALKARYTAMSATSLKDTVLMAYSHHVLDNLLTVLTHPMGTTDMAAALKGILAENRTLVNGTPVDYTALPEHDITRLLCDIAYVIADELKLKPIEVLLPGICLESCRDGYDNITADTDLKTLLKTHIKGHGGTYLLPVKLVTELDLTAASTQLGNPYFDFSNPVGNGYVDSDEFQRLVSHSSLTQAVFDAKQNYERLTSDTSTLLGQLKQLCNQLGVNMVGNLGREDNAGAGAYPAIIHFMEYYHQLDQAEKNNIPGALNQEINTLFSLVTDQTQNATANLSTCIATRRSELIKTMSGQDGVLNQISLSSTKKESRIEEARAQFDAAKASLINALERKTYTEGYDHFNLNTPLLSALGITIHIHSLADLNIIKALNPAEITSICSNPEIRQQIVTQLRHLENLVVFALEMSPDKLAAFLQVNRDELEDAFIRSPSDLSSLLISLDVEKCSIILAAWPDIIKSSYDLIPVLQPLSPEQCTAVLIALKDTLPDIITSKKDLIYTLEHLSPEQYTTLLVALRDKLTTLIKSGEDLNHMIRPLNPEQRTAVLVALMDKLAEFIKSDRDLSVTLRYLSSEQRSIVFNALRNKWPNIIKSPDDLGRVLQLLSPEECTAILIVLKDTLPKLINSSYDLQNTLEYLSTEQCTILLAALRDKLTTFIKSGYSLYRMLQPLSPEQRTTVLVALKDILPKLIESADDLKNTIEYLSPEQRSIVLDALKDKLPEIINSGYGLDSTLQYLSSEQRTIVLVALKDKLPEFINSSLELNHMLQPLNPEQCTAVLVALKDKLPNLIESGYDLRCMLKPLSPEKRTAVFDAMMDKLPEIIKSGYDLNCTFEYLSPEQRTIVFDAIMDKLPEFITSGDDLKYTLEYLNPEQCTIVFDASRDKLPEIIESSHSVRCILQHLSPEQRTPVFNVIMDKLPEFITSCGDLNDTLVYLSPEQRIIVFDASRDKLPEFITSGNDLKYTLEYLSPEQCIAVLDAMRDKLPEIIESIYDLSNILQYLLSPEKRTAVFNAMMDKLPELIKSVGDLNWVFDYLSPEQHNTAVSIIQLKDDLIKIAPDNHVIAFASALMSGDTMRIKAQFDHLIEQSTTPAELITALSNLEPRWMEKINIAVGLNLTATQLTSQPDIETGIHQYIAQPVENKKTMSHQYKQVIQSIAGKEEHDNTSATKLGKG